MNIITPINPMLTDEHVLAVNPKPLPDGVVTVRKRINAFQGRSLSADALTDLQTSRMAHQSMLGKAVSSGVVRGLDVTFVQPQKFEVRPGMGLTASGEDIFLGGSRNFNLADLPVLIQQSAGTPPSVKGFSELKSNAAILLAVPITFTYNSVPLGPANKFVPRDPVDDPFAGLQDIDGCLFALYPLSSNATLDPTKPSFRNDLVQAIFAEERGFENGAHHKWEEQGLPLALLGFNADLSVQFIDRASVVRRGGQTTPRTSVVSGVGTPGLRHAQLEQFGEQLGSLTALPDRLSDLQQTFPKLPPVGFLPRRLAGFESDDSIFPSTFNLRAVPVPQDQIDIIVRECVSLDAIDLAKGEDIELAFPVPIKDYDPMLMWEDSISPKFDEVIDDFLKHLRERQVHRKIVTTISDELALVSNGNFEVQPQDLLFGVGGLDEAFANRRLTKLISGTQCGFAPSGSGITLTLDESLYAWVWLDKDVTKFVVNTGGFRNFDRSPELVIIGNEGSLFRCVWGKSEKTKNDIFAPPRELPTPERWVRISVTALDYLQAKSTIILSHEPSIGANMDFNAFGFEVEGGTAFISSFGTLDSKDKESPLFLDALPEGGTSEIIPSNVKEWPWADPASFLGEDSYGTAYIQKSRVVPKFDEFTKKISGLKFLGSDADRLSKLPLSALVEVLQAQIRATTDAIDLAFLMARANTFRVREFMLGSDAASRLATSPALADVVKQDTSARVTGEQLQSFLEKSNFNFTRKITQ